MRDTEVTEAQWERIHPFLPPPHRGRGRPRADDRKVLNGILFVLRTGCCWEDIPREYASPATVGGDCTAGNKRAPGSGSGRPCWPRWTREASWPGLELSLMAVMAVSSRPKKGGGRGGAAPAWVAAAATPGVGSGQGLRQSRVSPMVAPQGDQGDDPTHRRAAEGAGQTGKTDPGGAGLSAAVKGGAVVCLVGAVPPLGGAS